MVYKIINIIIYVPFNSACIRSVILKRVNRGRQTKRKLLTGIHLYPVPVNDFPLKHYVTVLYSLSKPVGIGSKVLGMTAKSLLHSSAI